MPPYGAPTGAERGVYLLQLLGQPQSYAGLKYLMGPINQLRLLKDGATGPLVDPMPVADDGWLRFAFDEQAVNPTAKGGFVWLEYGSPASRPQLPRFLVAVWVPRPDSAVTGNAIDMLAPTAGEAPPPPAPAFSQANRPSLTIRSLVVCGYSRASVPLEQLLRTDNISASATDYPPALYGGDPVEFDARWQELWDLDFYLDEKDTAIPRARYEMALRQWLGRRDTRRLRICHSDYTLKGVAPDAYFPQLRSQLTAAPRTVRDPPLAARWATNWREPNGRWSALFFSDVFLRAKQSASVVPTFPLVTDPPPAIHGFTAQLAFGLASRLRTLP